FIRPCRQRPDESGPCEQGFLQSSVASDFGSVRYATSSSACGFFAAIASRVRAAPEGARRPCSQSCSVRTDTPSSWANRAWDSPVFLLARATSGTLITRPTSPRLISRRPWRISAPTSRIALAIFYLLANLAKQVSGNGVFHVLGVQRQHPD